MEGYTGCMDTSYEKIANRFVRHGYPSGGPDHPVPDMPEHLPVHPRGYIPPSAQMGPNHYLWRL
ncbi:MAG: hypothetical protein HYS81_03895 [Candidatus Aenigmatarchaeota archaeon]|nr:MAG: hypothetical protein HYS81_03895 [Candidatus Aenigmarchaeota archaeon]